MRGLLAIIVMSLAACSGSSLSVDLSNATVELDAYSGLPNPRWQLNAEEANQLEERLNGSPKTPAVEIPSQLGYRGFNIHDENGRRLTITSNGYVVVHDGAGDTFYRDTKDAQLWLKRQAEARGFGTLLIGR